MKLFTAVLTSSFTTIACAQFLFVPTQRDNTDDRLIEIIGEVDGDIIDKAAEINRLAELSDEPIELLINSPGGAVLPGMIFVDAMRAAKSEGIIFKCTSVVMAASMAYVIYSECNERYALANTRLLFHPISISTGGSRVQELIVDLDETIAEEKAIMEKLQKDLGLDWRKFHRHYFSETFWSATRLKAVAPAFLEIKDSVNFGPLTYKYRKQGLFGQSISNGTARKILERFEGVRND